MRLRSERCLVLVGLDCAPTTVIYCSPPLAPPSVAGVLSPTNANATSSLLFSLSLCAHQYRLSTFLLRTARRIPSPSLLKHRNKTNKTAPLHAIWWKLRGAVDVEPRICIGRGFSSLQSCRSEALNLSTALCTCPVYCGWGRQGGACGRGNMDSQCRVLDRADAPFYLSPQLTKAKQGTKLENNVELVLVP